MDVSNSGRSTALETFARNQNEEDAEGRVDEQRDSEHHDGALREELPDVGLSYPGEVKGRVLAVSDEGEDGVQRVLIRGKEVDAEGKGENELWGSISVGPARGSGYEVERTQRRVMRVSLRKIKTKAAQKPPNMDSSPMIRRMMRDAGIRLPSAFIRRKPGNASRSMAWKT